MNALKQTVEEYSSCNDQDSLIKIIAKLIGIIKTNEKSQKDVFIQLGDRGIQKIYNHTKSLHADLRKQTMKLLIELLYNNEVLQNIFCEKFNFNPIGSVICVNWFPKQLKENVRIDEVLIKEIKSSITIVNPNRSKYWMWPTNIKYTDDNFPDPEKYMVGFYFSSKSQISRDPIQNFGESMDTRQLNLKLEKSNGPTSNKQNNTLINNIKSIAAGSGSESASKINEKVQAYQKTLSSTMNPVVTTKHAKNSNSSNYNLERKNNNTRYEGAKSKIDTVDKKIVNNKSLSIATGAKKRPDTSMSSASKMHKSINFNHHNNQREAGVSSSKYK